MHAPSYPRYKSKIGRLRGAVPLHHLDCLGRKPIRTREVAQTRLFELIEIQSDLGKRVCHLQGPFWNPSEPRRGSTLSTSRIESSFGPREKKKMKDCSTSYGVQRLTNPNDIAVFLVQFRIIEILLSAKTEECKVKFGEFTKEWSRIPSERVPGRDSVEKDDSNESRPEKTEHLHGC